MIDREAVNSRLYDALFLLCELKHHKDQFGKTEWYKENQPKAWKEAFKLLNMSPYTR